MVQLSRRFIVPLLSVMLLGVAPAPANAATTITGAVVAIPVSGQDGWNAGYRLYSNRATYLATFGSGNSDALVTSTGGCAIKSGNVSCYGMAGTVGDGLNRNRPLAVPVTLPGGAQAVKLTQGVVQGMYFYDDDMGDYTYSSLRLLCAQGTSGVYCWGKNGGQTVLSPTTVFSGTPRLFTGTVLQDPAGAIYHWEPTDYSDSVSSYAMVKLAGAAGDLLPSQVTYMFPFQAGHQWSMPGIASQEVTGMTGVCFNSASQCLIAPLRAAMPAEVAALWPSVDDAQALTDISVNPGSPVESSLHVLCLSEDLVVSCSASEGYEYLNQNVGGIQTVVYAYKPRQFTTVMNLPEGSTAPVVGMSLNSGRIFSCAIHDLMGVVCVRQVESVDSYATDELMPDLDGDGYVSLGREFALDCGVGFSCAFTPTKLRESDGIVTAVGTLVRTPRTSTAISGTVRFPDGLPFQGTLEWNSSDRKLRATSTIAADGSFTLAARSGMGSITLHQEWGELPATCLDGTATAGCVTESETTIYLDTLAASSNVTITVPSYAGEMRTMDLRFGDGETPIADVALSIADRSTECTTTTVALGSMVSCARQGRGLTGDYENGIKTGSNGTVSIWMPTAMDSVLQASASDEYGLTWTDEIVSLGDDGVTPEPYSFAGLIFAQPLGAMSVRQGSTGTVSALVSVDGIDPAYGLSAGIKPASTVASTCTAERRTDATDENGLVDFSLCPAGTQLWKVYATDGSFFPSAPFPVTIDPALTALRISGATLDTAFSGGTTTYTGRFTSSRVTFTPTKASWAGSARVTTPTCSRPSRGTRDCTMSVKVGSATITYTFTLRR